MSDIDVEVYRTSPADAVGVLECRATHRPTGLTATASGTGGSGLIVAAALAKLNALIAGRDGDA